MTYKKLLTAILAAALAYGTACDGGVPIDRQNAGLTVDVTDTDLATGDTDVVLRDCWQDADSDGDGDEHSSPVQEVSCQHDRGLSPNHNDCDDSDYFINPGVDEVCGNHADDNCDGQVDEGCLDNSVVCYPDIDQDNFGDKYGGGHIDSDGQCAQNESTNHTDCDDSVTAVNPLASESCSNGIDDDCDGLIDTADPECPVANSCYQDLDGDTYGSTVRIACTSPDAVSRDGDCRDSGSVNGVSAFYMNPGRSEICGDGVDNDCSGSIDDGCGSGTTVLCYNDGDQDGYGDLYDTNPRTSSTGSCSSYESLNNSDCKDTDATIHSGCSVPGATRSLCWTPNGNGSVNSLTLSGSTTGTDIWSSPGSQTANQTRTTVSGTQKVCEDVPYVPSGGTYIANGRFVSSDSDVPTDHHGIEWYMAVYDGSAGYEKGYGTWSLDGTTVTCRLVSNGGSGRDCQLTAP